MATNALQVATINTVGDFILFLGKVLIAAVSGIIGLFLLKDRPDLNFYIAPVVLIIVFSFFIAHIVLSLFEVIYEIIDKFSSVKINKMYLKYILSLDGSRHTISLCL